MAFTILPSGGVPAPTPAPRQGMLSDPMRPAQRGILSMPQGGVMQKLFNADMLPAWLAMATGGNQQQQMQGFAQGMTSAQGAIRERTEIDRQMAEQRARDAKAMAYIRTQAPQYAGAVEAGVLDPASAFKASMAGPEAPKPTDDMREYEFARGQGFDGSFLDFQNTVKGAGAPRNYGTIPQGFELIETPTGARLQPISGGPADTSVHDARAQEIKNRAGDIVIDDIRRAKEIIQNDGMIPATGVGSYLQNVPGTDAHSLRQKIQTIKANAAFDKLQQMREASPTGGALGAVSAPELALLESAIGSLEQSQDDEDLLYNLDRVEQIYMQIIHGQQGAAMGTQPRPTGSTSSGISWSIE